MSEQINNDKQEPIIFVTDDRFLRERRNLDPVDEQMMREVAQVGEVIMMSLAESLEAMKEEDPEKFTEFQKQQESQVGGALTIAEIAELASGGDERKQIYDEYVALALTERQATQIRVWRTRWYYSWRGIARAAFGRVISKEWGAWRLWYPPTNQVMGMSLCDRAARYFGENYQKPPWN